MVSRGIGDFAFRRIGNESGFPWLTASRLAELLLYQPVGHDGKAKEPLANTRPHALGEASGAS